MAPKLEPKHTKHTPYQLRSQARTLAEHQEAQLIGLRKIQRFEDLLVEPRTVEAQLLRQQNVLPQMSGTGGCP